MPQDRVAAGPTKYSNLGHYKIATKSYKRPDKMLKSNFREKKRQNILTTVPASKFYRASDKFRSFVFQ